jgi:uncharacterized protein (TIRG00374 family)
LNKKAYIIGVLLSVLVIGYVLFTLDWGQVGSTFLKLKWGWVILGFFIYLVNYLLRAIRFRTLLGLEEIPFLQLLGVTNLYGMYLYLLPAKFGEITFPVILKRRAGADLSTSTGSLIVARVFDFLTIALILPLISIIYWQIMPQSFRISIAIFCALIFSLFLFFIWMLRNPDRVNPVLNKPQLENQVIKKILKFISDVYHGIRGFDEMNRYMDVFLVTLGIWLCINTTFFLITLSLGYSFDFFQIVVVSIIMVPVTLFPIQGFANLGAHELGWTTAFALFDYPYLDALNIAVSSHIIYVLFVLLLGAIGSVFLYISREQRGY